jgi:hypothetical protein
VGDLEIEPSEPTSHVAADGGGRRQQIRARLRDLRETTPRRVQVAGGALVVVVLLVGVVLMAGRSGGDAEDASRLETIDGERDQPDRHGSRDEHSDERSSERRRGAILDLDEETLQRYGYGRSSGGLPSAGAPTGPRGPVEWDGSGLDLRQHFGRNLRMSLPGLSFEMPADFTPPTETPGETGDTTTTTTTSTPSTSTTTTTAAPAAADLSVALADWRREEDGRFGVAIQVTNSGPQRSDQLELEVTLPANAALTEGWQPSGGWACEPPAGGILQCTRGQLNAGSTAELKVDGTGAPTPGSVSATVSAKTADPDAKNNTATHTW